MEFQTWLEKQLEKPIPAEVIAFNFNLYEEDETEFDVQIVGCPSYDADDSDWACDAIFSSEEDLFHFSSKDWETALEDFQAILENYLASGVKNALTDSKYIAMGFVDGDLIPIRE